VSDLFDDLPANYAWRLIEAEIAFREMGDGDRRRPAAVREIVELIDEGMATAEALADLERFDSPEELGLVRRRREDARVAVHNSSGRAWFEPPGEHQIPCGCGWAPELGRHYRRA
jgi:hypothetical protein